MHTEGLGGALSGVDSCINQAHIPSRVCCHETASATWRGHGNCVEVQDALATILGEEDPGERLGARDSRAETWSLCVFNRLKDAGKNHLLLRASDPTSEVHNGPDTVFRHRQYSAYSG